MSNLPHDVITSTILIVEDNEINRLFLEKILKKYGFQNIIHAENGQQALKKIEASQPDLILLDLMMPEMDGFECCKKIRALPEYGYLPIPVQTALTKEEDRLRAFAAGATDLVTKPVCAEELYARVNVHLENLHSLRKLKIYKDRVEAELKAARELQYSILPAETQLRAIEDACDVNVAAYFEPSSEIGGDFWGIKKLSADAVAFWVVDFSGHSVSAALNVFRLQAYIQEDSLLSARPGEYLSMLNEKLLHLLTRGQFATMFYGVIDQQKNQLFYASAGSPHPVLLHHNHANTSIINATGRPLGISAHCYVTQSVEFLPGDTIFFYSDALTETSDTQGKCIDDRVLLHWLREIDTTPKNAVREILDRFNQHAGKTIHDDLTMGMIQRRPTAVRKRAHG